MNPIAYLTTPDPLFGWVEWILFISQIVLLLVGAYFSFLYRDRDAVKMQALQRFGYVLLALSGLGVVLGGLKLGVVAPFDTRVWSILILMFEIALGVYGLVYSRTTYPEQAAAAAASSRRTAGRPNPARPNPARKAAAVETPSPRAVEVSSVRTPGAGRSASRRDRKRKKR